MCCKADKVALLGSCGVWGTGDAFTDETPVSVYPSLMPAHHNMLKCHVELRTFSSNVFT